MTSLANMSGALSAVEWLSPFNYYLGSDPLVKGMNWGDAVALAMPVLALIGLSLVLFQRRDIRKTG